MSEISEGAQEAANIILQQFSADVSKQARDAIATVIQNAAVAPAEVEAAQWQEASGQANVRAEQLEDALAKAERQRDGLHTALLGGLASAGICTPTEGYLAPSSPRPESGIAELKRQRNEARAELERVRREEREACEPLIEAASRAHVWLTLLAGVSGNWNKQDAKGLNSTIRILFEALEKCDPDKAAAIRNRSTEGDG